jgi:DNA polymerase-3 subunit gamma/tau
VPVDDIVRQLKKIAESEGLNAEPEALTLIARQSAGGMRDAISLLDQMASSGKEITLDLTQSMLGTATSQTVIGLVSAVQEHDPAAGMEAIHTALDAGSDPRLLARQLVDYLRALLLIQMGNGSQVDLASETREQAEKHARTFTSVDVLQMIKSFNAAASDLRGGWQPSLPLEMALSEVMEMAAHAESRSVVKAVNAKVVDRQTLRMVDSQIKETTERPAYKEFEKTTKDTFNKPTGKVNDKQLGKPINAVMQSGEENVKDVHSIGLEQLTNAWKQIRGLIKPQSSSLDGLLNSCKLLEVKDGMLVIGFKSELLRSKVDTPELIEITRKAISEVCGFELGIKCVVSNVKQVPPQNVKADGMVAAALKHGGEIVDTQE